MHRYEHIIKPLQIGNRVLKNRLLSTKVVSMQLQANEAFPAEGTIAYMEQLARNGAAIVCCAMGGFPDENGRLSPMVKINMRDWDVLSYYTQMTDRIHAHGSLASASLQNVEPQDVAISDTPNWDEIPRTGDYSRNFDNKPGISRERLKALIDEFVSQAKFFKRLGFDMVTVYMSYRGGILANSLSPILNQRSDEYGGSIENRARLTLEIFKGIKDACGKDFLIECQVSATEEQPGGYTFDEFVEYAKLVQDYVDIFQLRAWEGSLCHGNGYNTVKGNPYMLSFSEGLKKAGIRSLVSPVGSFQNLDDIERFIAEGKCDCVSMGRAFLCDSEYGKKLYGERGEDVMPCLRCNRCHGGTCAVNPRSGRTHYIDRMFSPPERSKKVAVIGGGPAGMYAAITAAKRGHNVTLYDREKKLGGQLNHADFLPFKWPLKDFRDHLIEQVIKSAVTVRCGAEVTAEMIKTGGFDAAIAACGAAPTVPDTVPGAAGENVWMPIDVFGNEEKLGRRVVVIGGADIGYETGLYLAQHGHEVTVLSRKKRIPCDEHARKAVEEYVRAQEGFTYLPQAFTKEIKDGAVIYTDADGAEHRIEFDSVVFSGGRTPCVGEAMKFTGLTNEFYLIGDARLAASAKEAMYSAYTAAMSI